MAASPPGFRAALAVPDFRRLALGLSVDSVGGWAYGVVLLVYVFERTHSPTWVAVTSVLRYLPGLLFSTYAGVLAERFERTRVLIASSLASAAAMAGITATVALHGPVGLVVAFAFASASFGTPFVPAVGSLVPQLVEERLLAPANALLSTIENVATIAGPGIGAVLLLADSPSIAFAFNGLTFLWSAACISRIKTRSRPTDVTEQGAGLLRQMSVGFRALHELPAARLPVLISALSTFVFGADTVLFVQISNHLGGGASGYGYLVSALAVGGVVAAVVVVNRLASRGQVASSIALGMAVWCLPTAAIPLLHNMAGGVVVEFTRGVGGIVVDVLALTAMQRAVPTHLLSRVLGVFDTLSFAGAAVGALMVPPLLRSVGLTTTLLIVSFGAFGISLLALPGLRRLDRASQDAVRALEPIIERLSRLALLDGTERTGLEQLARSVERIELPSGTVVLREGDVADAFYVVVEGEVRVTSHAESGADVELRRLGPESYFGEIGLLHGIRRTATVMTVTDTALLRITADGFVSAVSSETASPALLLTAGTRLARTHPDLAADVAEGGAQS